MAAASSRKRRTSSVRLESGTSGGDLASLPLLQRFGLAEAARASCYLYTTLEEVDRLADALQALSQRRRAP